MSYEGHQEDKAKVLSAIGGTRGLIDSGLPSIIFLITFNIWHNISRAAVAAVALSLIFAIVRLFKRETLQHAISGVVGVLFCALLARHVKPSLLFPPELLEPISSNLNFGTSVSATL